MLMTLKYLLIQTAMCKDTCYVFVTLVARYFVYYLELLRRKYSLRRIFFSIAHQGNC